MVQKKKIRRKVTSKKRKPKTSAKKTSVVRAKADVKKKQVKTVKKVEENDSSFWIWAAILVIVGFGIYFFMNSGHSGHVVSNNNAGQKTNDEVLAVVNGVKITESELQQYLMSVPVQYRSQVDKAALLNDIIGQKLLEMDAKKHGIEFDQKGFDQFFNNYLNASGKTLDQLKAELNQTGIDYSAFMNNMKLIYLINQYLEKYLYNKINVTDSELKTIYDMNKKYYNGSFEEVKPELIKQVKRLKLATFLPKYIKQLKLEANISAVAPYNLELCLLNAGLKQKVFVYASSNCAPCDKVKNELNESKIGYYAFDSGMAKKCFAKIINEAKGAMPLVICRDGTFTLNQKNITQFVQNCN